MWDLRNENYVADSLEISTPKTPALIPKSNRDILEL